MVSISENAKNSKPESLPQRAQQTRETSVNYNPKGCARKRAITSTVRTQSRSTEPNLQGVKKGFLEIMLVSEEKVTTS